MVYVLVLYLIAMLLVGLYFYRRTNNLSDYILGGRQLNPWVTALSAQASDMSGWLLLGLPGYAYTSGLESVWIAVGLMVGTYLNWKFVAKKLRVFSMKTSDALTISSYFQKRFKEDDHKLRLVTSVFILFFFLIYTASGLVGSAKLFNTVFGLSYHVALVLGLVTVVAYTFLGGFMAVSWTDLFQGVLMFIALMIVPFVLLGKVGGVGGMNDLLSSLDDSFTSLNFSGLGVLGIISLLAWGMGYFGQPHILARFMAIRDPKEIKTSRIISMVWVVLTLVSAVAVGFLGRLYYMGDVSFSSETVFLQVSKDIFPTVIAGVLLAAVLAAIMSTADSQLLVSSSAFVEDFYKVVSKKELSDKQQVMLGRLLVVVLSVLALLSAWNEDASILKLVSYAWAGLGATFGPAVLFSLYDRKVTYHGTVVGMLLGGLTVIVWKNFLNGGIFDVYEMVPAFLVSSLAIYVVSRLDSKSQDEEYFDYLNEN